MQDIHSITRSGSQYLIDGFPVLGMPDELRAVKYFSLNPFLPDQLNRCPLECAYCVCHLDSGWHHHPEAYKNVTPPESLIEQLLDCILETKQGQSGFPISLCDYSDPFIPVHRQRVLDILAALIKRGASNMVYITTKVHPGAKYLARLNSLLSQLHSLRVTVFVSLPPLKAGYEKKVSISKRVKLIADLTALNIPTCWYLRPLTEAWYDEALMWSLSRQIIALIPNHIILSGLIMSDEIEHNIQIKSLTVPDWKHEEAGKKQLLNPEFENGLRHILSSVAKELNIDLGPVMGHRLCGTNGNHAYGCLICGKEDRYCQFFQIHHYGKTINADENQAIKIRMIEPD